MPIAFFRNGVCVPLVTTPTGRAAARPPDSPAARCRDRSSRSRPACAQCRVSFCSTSRSRPMNSPLFQPMVQPRSGLEHRRRLVDVVAVQAHRGLEPQRVARAEAARDDVRRSSRFEQRLPDAGRPCSAGRRSRSRPRRCSRCARSWRARRPLRRARTSSSAMSARSTVAQRLQHLERGRALHRDQRVPAARVDDRRVADGLDLLADPGEVLGDVRGVDHQQEVARRHAVDEHVVDERPVGRQQRRSTAPARPRARWRRCTRSAARRPARPCRRSRSRPCG